MGFHLGFHLFGYGGSGHCAKKSIIHYETKTLHYGRAFIPPPSFRLLPAVYRRSRRWELIKLRVLPPPMSLCHYRSPCWGGERRRERKEERQVVHSTSIHSLYRWCCSWERALRKAIRCYGKICHHHDGAEMGSALLPWVAKVSRTEIVSIKTGLISIYFLCSCCRKLWIQVEIL